MLPAPPVLQNPGMNTNLTNRGAHSPGPQSLRNRGWLAAAALLLVSCSEGEVHKTPIAVKGLVTIDGKPLADASIGLFPDTYGVGRACTGKSDKTGAFSLTTFVDQTTTTPGVEPGSYQAIVTKLSKVQPRDGSIKSDIPTRYSDVQKSDLKVVISEESDQTVKFELRSK